MNIEEKTKLAHEWSMWFLDKNKDMAFAPNTVAYNAWGYADAMEAEAEKRIKAEAKEKREAVRKLLNDNGTFLEKEGMHFDDVADLCNTYSSSEWQPDWSQAPEWAKYWTADDFACYWWSLEPKYTSDAWHFAGGRTFICNAPTFNYQGDWKDSLRKRP